MPKPDRIERFLSDTAFATADVALLAGDASARRYFRLRNSQGHSAVLMDGPADVISAFASMTGRLQRAGYSVPEVLCRNEAEGLLLGEDLGDALYVRVIDSEETETTLYLAAVDLLVDLCGRPELASGLPQYDMDFYLFETDIFLDWYMPGATGAAVPEDLHAVFRDGIRDALGRLSPAEPVCVLRDYHAENLIWLPDRSGLARVGLLDYQDARAGHVVYDIASLLFDARRNVSEGVISLACQRFVAALALDQQQFEADLALLTLQRTLKIMGIFARLCARDGKPGYLRHLPRVWGYVEQALSHPSIGELRDLIRDAVPPPDANVIEGISGWQP